MRITLTIGLIVIIQILYGQTKVDRFDSLINYVQQIKFKSF